MVATSRAKGRNRSRSGISWREEIFPVRRARIHCAARAMGPVILQRTISSVMRTIRKTWAKTRTKVSRHTRRLSARM